MGLFDDILTGLPVNPLLREKMADIEAKYAASETENACLKDDLREATTVITELKQRIKELTQKGDDLGDTEVRLLKQIAELEIANCTVEILSQLIEGSQARLRHYVQKLETAGYVHTVFVDDCGAHYAAAPKGLELLVEKNLI